MRWRIIAWARRSPASSTAFHQPLLPELQQKNGLQAIRLRLSAIQDRQATQNVARCVGPGKADGTLLALT
jgi:hypothetical protein